MARTSGGVPPLAGITTLLDALAAAGVRVGVVTNAPREAAAHTLGVAGLAGRFGVVVVADDVARPKPDAAPYVAGCRAVGVPPGEVRLGGGGEAWGEASGEARAGHGGEVHGGGGGGCPAVWWGGRKHLSLGGADSGGEGALACRRHGGAANLAGGLRRRPPSPPRQ